jgi:1-phosphofructokinase
MIYTVTLNPSVDYIVRIPSFSVGKVNRADYEAVVAGGKGINVSVMLHQLGVESTALGFIAGFTGAEIQRLVCEMGCRERFIMLSEGFSRINVKMKTETESELNGAGPMIPKASLDALMAQINALQTGDVLVLSGSVPRSVPETIYRDMAALLTKKNVMVVADASGKLLLDILPHRPFLIKPNHHELGALFGVDIETKEYAVIYAKKLQEMGARNVLVSMASKGAVLISEKGSVHTASAPERIVVNSVGAGDSMLAGFLAGYLEKGSYDDALKLGIAAGSASAFSEGIATFDKVKSLLL